MDLTLNRQASHTGCQSWEFLHPQLTKIFNRVPLVQDSFKSINSAWGILQHSASRPAYQLQVFVADDNLGVVSEYPSGGCLADKIAAEGPVTEGQAKSLFLQLLSGMQYCHDTRQGLNTFLPISSLSQGWPLLQTCLATLKTCYKLAISPVWAFRHAQQSSARLYLFITRCMNVLLCTCCGQSEHRINST